MKKYLEQMNIMNLINFGQEKVILSSKILFTVGWLRQSSSTLQGKQC